MENIYFVKDENETLIYVEEVGNKLFLVIQTYSPSSMTLRKYEITENIDNIRKLLKQYKGR